LSKPIAASFRTWTYLRKSGRFPIRSQSHPSRELRSHPDERYL
jgi:hypothetical protein